MRKLIILRGPSGSGKSTIADCLFDRFEGKGYTHYEADHFFLRGWNCGVGEYHFDANKLGSAHTWCRTSIERAMFHGVDSVVVSNTSMRIKEIQPYLDLAKEYGYELEILRTPGPWDADTLFARNVHSVPLDVIRKQIARYVPHDNETEWTDMSVFKR